LAASGGKLTAIQKRVLEALASVEPPFVLGGGAALAGVYLGHRTTRDLDLFWRNRADSPLAILAEKLCALLERSELRDLIDIEALVRNGELLQTAIDDAPRRDSGFSPLTLARILRTLDVAAMAPSSGIDPPAAQRLDDFRRWLIDRLVEPDER